MLKIKNFNSANNGNFLSNENSGNVLFVKEIGAG